MTTTDLYYRCTDEALAIVATCELGRVPAGLERAESLTARAAGLVAAGLVPGRLACHAEWLVMRLASIRSAACLPY
jgi:hypothetical protein